MNPEQSNSPAPSNDTQVQNSQPADDHVSQPQSNDPLPAQTSNAASPAKAKSKKLFITLIIVWLLAFPVAYGLNVLGRVAFSNDTTNTQTTGTNLNSGVAPIDEPAKESKSSPVRAGLNIASLLLGMYGLLGWIPVVIVAIKKKQ